MGTRTLHASAHIRVETAVVKERIIPYLRGIWTLDSTGVQLEKSENPMMASLEKMQVPLWKEGSRQNKGKGSSLKDNNGCRKV